MDVENGVAIPLLLVNGQKETQIGASTSFNCRRNMKAIMLSTGPATISFVMGALEFIPLLRDEKPTLCTDDKAPLTALVVIGCVTGIFAIISSCYYCNANPKGNDYLHKALGLTIGLLGLGANAVVTINLIEC
jgi:hypothetical protein